MLHHAHHTPGRGFHDLGIRLARPDIRHDACEKLFGVAGELSRRFSLFEQIKQALALQRNRRCSHHLPVALIEQDRAAVCVEHAKTLGHVFQRSVQQYFLLPQRVFRAAIGQGRHQTEAQNDSGGAGNDKG